MLGKIELLPHIEEQQRKEFFDTLARGADGLDDIMKGADDYSGIEQLKKELNG